MIKSGANKESIELHIKGEWKNYENIEGASWILTNVGNDFGNLRFAKLAISVFDTYLVYF